MKKITYLREKTLFYLSLRRKYKNRARHLLSILHKIDASTINHEVKETYRNQVYEMQYETTCDIEQVTKEIEFWLNFYRMEKDNLPYSCVLPCSPSDYVENGKCDINSCYHA